MSASALLAQLKEAGVSVEAEGGNLRLKGPKGVLGNEVLTELRANKAELLDALKTPPASTRSQEGRDSRMASRNCQRCNRSG